jgi:hypothetical protein
VSGHNISGLHTGVVHRELICSVRVVFIRNGIPGLGPSKRMPRSGRSSSTRFSPMLLRQDYMKSVMKILLRVLGASEHG